MRDIYNCYVRSCQTDTSNPVPRMPYFMARQEYLSRYYKESRRLIQLLVALQILRKASQFTFYCNQK